MDGGTPSQRAIRLSSAALAAASFGDRTHARLQHARAAVILEAGDLIAGGFRVQPHGEHHAAAASS